MSGLLYLGPWYEVGVVRWPRSINAMLSFSNLVEDLFSSNQHHFPDLQLCGVDQVWLISLYKLHDFRLDSSSDEVDNHATVIGHTEFGLLGQLI